MPFPRYTGSAGGGAERIIGSRVDLPIGTPATDLKGLIPMAGQILNIADKPKLAARMSAVNTLATAFSRTYKYVEGPSSIGYSVIWFNNMWITSAIDGSSYYIFTSPDGSNFTRRQSLLNGFGQSQVQVIDFAVIGTRCYALTNGSVYSTDDGITWTMRAHNSSANAGANLAAYAFTGGVAASIIFSSMKALNGLLIIAGAKIINSTWQPHVWSSLDGITWTERPTGNQASGPYGYEMAYGLGLYALVCGSGIVMTSPDLVTWTLRTTGITESMNTIVFDGTLFFAVGSTGRSLTSLDGVNWAKGIVNNGISTPKRIIYANGLYALISSSIALDGRARMLFSSDRVNWRSERPDATETAFTPNGIAVQGTRFAVVFSGVSSYIGGFSMTALPNLNPATQFYVPYRDAGDGMVAYIVAD